MEHLMENAISLALLVKPFLFALVIVEKIVDFSNQKKERVQVKFFTFFLLKYDALAFAELFILYCKAMNSIACIQSSLCIRLIILLR